jgi:methylenetetrahydrofolate dehydrogenase (NADP+)/methenyltetrahydrofolate cyclohydrolase
VYEAVHCTNNFLKNNMILIDGKKVASELREELKKEVAELRAKHNKVPGLTVILIGDLTPSQIYVRNKEKSANEVGLKSDVIRYPDSVKEKIVLEKISELNKDEAVSGILVQLPLPKHIDKKKVIEAIDPSKDVDGFHPMNVGNLSSGYESSVPCTPLGCYLLIKKIEPNLNGKKAVIIGRSNLNGKPMTQLLLKENCTVTITHSKTKDLKSECLEADIIVAAVGIPELVKGDWIKEGTIVIDVGINKTEKGLVGDVHFEEVFKVAKAITPVPGGVGPMTIACLLKNTIDCFKRSQI